MTSRLLRLIKQSRVISCGFCKPSDAGFLPLAVVNSRCGERSHFNLQSLPQLPNPKIATFSFNRNELLLHLGGQI